MTQILKQVNFIRMPKFYTFFIIAVLAFSFDGLRAQDLHFTQFFNAPLHYNPALTGAYNGDMRLMGNYRRQWKTVPVDYLTFSGGGDMRIGQRKNANIGLLFDYDRAGDLSLSLTKLALSGSYFIKLKNRHYLSPGIQVGYNQRRLDLSKAQSGNQWNGVGFDPTITPEIPFNSSNIFFEASAGLNYRYHKSYRTHLDVGVGLHNLFASDQSFAENYSSPLDRRLSLYAMGDFKILSKLNLLGNILYQAQGPHSELQLNIQGKAFLNKNKDRNKAIILGLSLRGGDSWGPMIAVLYQNLYAGLSYDVNFSGFDIATTSRGGPELSIMYRLTKVGNIPFKPCPIY